MRESGIVRSILSAANAASKVNKSCLRIAYPTMMLKKEVARKPKLGKSKSNERATMFVKMKVNIGIAKPTTTYFLVVLCPFFFSDGEFGIDITPRYSG
jgi:hypothetical protein